MPPHPDLEQAEWPDTVPFARDDDAPAPARAAGAPLARAGGAALARRGAAPPHPPASAPASPGAPALPGVPTPPSAAVLQLQALALQHESFEPAAQAVLAELQRRLQCERVSLGLAGRGERLRVVALSAGDSQARHGLVRALADAMREALEEAGTVLHPLPPGTASAPLPAHAELAQRSGGVLIASVPIVGPRRTLGVLVFERRHRFDGATLQAAQDAALFVAPVLAQLYRLGLPLGGRLWYGAAALHPSAARRRWQTAGWSLTATAATAALAAWPTAHEVVAPARMEGGLQQVVASPADGYIARVEVRPGALVKAGQLLVQLEDRDVELTRQRLAAEVAQHDKQYREALTLDEPPAIALARAKLQQAQVQLAQAEREVARTRLTAPIDGIVVSGDLSQAQGMPVQRGQALLTLAPAGQLKVVAEVGEQDIPHLVHGQPAQVLFAAAGSAPLPFTLKRISPVALPLEGRNVFEVEGEIAPVAAAASAASAAPGAAGALPRHGQRGVARIEVGQRPRAALWWAELADAWRRWSWRWLG